jgi:hypothetical protein
MKKLILLAIISLSFFSGCTEDVKLNVIGGKLKILIEGRIENGKVAEVFVMRSNSISSTKDYKDFFYIYDAVVTVSDGTATETLKLGYNAESTYYFPYLGSSLKGEVGKTYTLKVVAAPDPDKPNELETYTATTTIPAPIKLDSVWWKDQAPYDTLGYAWAHLSEPAGLGNAYKWYARRGNKYLRPGEIRDRRYLAPAGSTFEDKFIDGKSFDLSYFRATDPSDSLSQADKSNLEFDSYFKNTDTVYIKFCTIDQNSYKFYSTYETAYQTNGNPFVAPVSILSNISEGGLGVWAGFGCTYDTIYPK